MSSKNKSKSINTSFMSNKNVNLSFDNNNKNDDYKEEDQNTLFTTFVDLSKQLSETDTMSKKNNTPIETKSDDDNTNAVKKDNNCKYCDKKLASKKSLKNHENICKKKPAENSTEQNKNTEQKDNIRNLTEENSDTSESDEYEDESGEEDDELCKIDNKFLPVDNDNIDLSKDYITIDNVNYNINEIVGNIDIYNLKNKDLNDPRNKPNIDLLQKHYNLWLTKKTCQYVDTLMKVEFNKMQMHKNGEGDDMVFLPNMSNLPNYTNLCDNFNGWISNKIKGYVEELLRVEKYKKDKQNEYKEAGLKIPKKYKTDPLLEEELEIANKKINIRNEFLVYFFNKRYNEKRQFVIDYLVNNGVNPNDLLKTLIDVGIINKELGKELAEEDDNMPDDVEENNESIST